MKRNNRNIVFCILAASLLLCCASCKKDKETEMVTLKLALEQPTDPSANQKVYLDNQKLVNWYTNDVIVINNGSGTFDASVVNNTANVQAGNGTFTALYPKANGNSAGDGTVTVTIPAVQTYVEGSDGMQNLKDLPMAAYLNTSESSVPPVLMFRNLASLIKVTVTNPNATYTFRVNSIKLSSSAANLHGTYTYSFNNRSSNKTVPTVTRSTSPTYGKEIMLDFNHTWTTIAGGSSKDFYLVVAPVSTASSFTIDVRGAVVGEAQISGGENVGNNYTEAIKVYSKTLTDANGGSSSKTLARSIIGKVSANLSGFNVHGGFHVSSSQVSYFSHGNLSVGYNGGNGVPAFCVGPNGEQYHRNGITNNAAIRAKPVVNFYAQAGVEYPQYRHGDYLDLFRYVENYSGSPYCWYYPNYYAPNTSYNALGEQPYNRVKCGINQNKDYDYFSSFPAVSTYFPYALASVYADAAGVWRIPKRSEWVYLMGTRSVSGNSLNAYFAKAIVANVNGVILFPDVYSQPDGITISNIDDGTASFSGNSISHSKWKLMEAAGAIFLPTTGRLLDLGTTTGEPLSPGVFYFNTLGIWGGNSDAGYYWIDGGVQSSSRIYSRFVFNNGNVKTQPSRLWLQEVDDIEKTTSAEMPAVHAGNGANNWAYILNIFYAIRPIRD